MRRGRRAEEAVEWACRRLAERGIAWVRKTEPRVTVRRAAGGRIVSAGFVGSAPPDFVGFTPRRGICFDVKQADEDGSFTWIERRPLTKARQVQDLTEVGKRFDAIAGVLVVFWAPPTSDERDRAVWVPWWNVPDVAEGRWKIERLIESRVGVDCPWPVGGSPDWMAASAIAEAQLIREAAPAR